MNAPLKMVLCVWEDASDLDVGPWVERATAPEVKATVFHQVGFLLKLNAAEVILTACVGDEQMGTRGRIPAGMVRSLVELGPQGKAIKIPKHRKPRKVT